MYTKLTFFHCHDNVVKILTKIYLTTRLTLKYENIFKNVEEVELKIENDSIDLL